MKLSLFKTVSWPPLGGSLNSFPFHFSLPSLSARARWVPAVPHQSSSSAELASSSRLLLYFPSCRVLHLQVLAVALRRFVWRGAGIPASEDHAATSPVTGFLRFGIGRPSAASQSCLTPFSLRWGPVFSFRLVAPNCSVSGSSPIFSWRIPLGLVRLLFVGRRRL